MAPPFFVAEKIGSDIHLRGVIYYHPCGSIRVIVYGVLADHRFVTVCCLITRVTALVVLSPALYGVLLLAPV